MTGDAASPGARATVSGEAVCKHCDAPIYLPPERPVCFLTAADDDDRCPWSPWGWHDPKQP